MAGTSKGNGVSVSMAAVIDQLHQKYTAQLARLTQENAELQAAVDAQGDELDELRSRMVAMGSGGVPGDLGPLLGGMPQPAPGDAPAGLLGGPDARIGQTLE